MLNIDLQPQMEKAIIVVNIADVALELKYGRRKRNRNDYYGVFNEARLHGRNRNSSCLPCLPLLSVAMVYSSNFKENLKWS
jgi:hypothetical protein